MRHRPHFTIITFCFTALILIFCNQSGKTSEADKSALITNLTSDQKSIVINVSVQRTNLPTSDTSAKGDLSFLRNYDGKYPYKVKLLDNPVLTKRLKKLLGNRYKFFKDTWNVEIPIEVKDNIFKASACEAHNCSSTNFIILADLSKNVLYAGIREDDQVKKYSENGSDLKQLNDWAAGE